MTIHVLLADDQELLRTTFRLLIESTEDMTVVGEAKNGEEAIALTRTHHPTVVLMDIRMPGTNGLTATKTICDDPTLTRTRILILTTFETEEYIAQALRAGASGFLGKDTNAESLLTAIRTIATGDSLLSPTATKTLIARFLATPDPQTPTKPLTTLTTREREVMALAAEGKTNTEIAAHLTVSPLTARTHIQRAMTKLNARDRAQLVVIAYQSGLVKPPMA